MFVHPNHDARRNSIMFFHYFGWYYPPGLEVFLRMLFWIHSDIHIRETNTLMMLRPP